MQARDSTSEVKLPPSDCSRLHQYSAEEAARRGGPGGWIPRTADNAEVSGTMGGEGRMMVQRGGDILSRRWGEERRGADVPDSVDVLDGVADLLAKFLLVKLHLQGQKRQRQLNSDLLRVLRNVSVFRGSSFTLLLLETVKEVTSG